MIPISFTIKDNITIFHYKFSDLRIFVTEGKLRGNVGAILIKRSAQLITYKGFGTIENPYHSMVTISIYHNDLFDGKMPSDESRIIAPDAPLMSTNYRMIFLN